MIHFPPNTLQSLIQLWYEAWGLLSCGLLQIWMSKRPFRYDSSCFRYPWIICYLRPLHLISNNETEIVAISDAQQSLVHSNYEIHPNTYHELPRLRTERAQEGPHLWPHSPVGDVVSWCCISHCSWFHPLSSWLCPLCHLPFYMVIELVLLSAFISFKESGAPKSHFILNFVTFSLNWYNSFKLFVGSHLSNYNPFH